ncbi:MAG TPA: Fe-S cluster assembly protein SufD [Nevskiaceae bacterium]|nr:Fe-S cluster assembly protein SufD [Nevskiaceae bacterium]
MSAALRQYIDAFEQFSAALPREEKSAREKELAAFLAQGFPHRKIEEWKYTDLSALADKTYAQAPAVAGGLAPVRGSSSVAHLNAAFAQPGLQLRVAAGAQAEDEYNTRMDGARMQHLHHRIALAADAQATVILHHAGSGEYLTTQVLDIDLADGAQLSLYRVQDEAGGSHHLAHTSAQLGRDASITVVTVDLGAGLARHDLDIALTAPGASAQVHGLYVPARGAHVDNHTRIDHRAPHGSSREFFRGIVGERCRAIFNGKVIVQEGAVKTDSEQRVANLLLSPRAEVNAKPELEIYNDDVKCAHGATFGQLDESAIYYLRARGIGREQARALLTHAFAQEVLQHLAHEPTRTLVTRRLDALLGAAA